jgi:hypothetical protein
MIPQGSLLSQIRPPKARSCSAIGLLAGCGSLPFSCSEEGITISVNFNYRGASRLSFRILNAGDQPWLR